jgi:hypothetical protein
MTGWPRSAAGEARRPDQAHQYDLYQHRELDPLLDVKILWLNPCATASAWKTRIEGSALCAQGPSTSLCVS